MVAASSPPVIQTVEVKSVLSRSGISGIDYSLNPYLGCLFGCRSMGREAPAGAGGGRP